MWTALVAGVVASGVMQIAWVHNPQGEFHDEGGIRWSAWLALGLCWFLAASVPVSLVLYAVLRQWSADGPGAREPRHPRNTPPAA
jgi:hypothetical protein